MIDPTMTGCLIKPLKNTPQGPKKRLTRVFTRVSSGTLAKVDEDAATLWMDLHLNHSRERLRGPAWILDLDATVKPFNGEQEEVRSGYNRAPEWCSALVGESPTAGGIGMTG
jgi:hypothetical protein